MPASRPQRRRLMPNCYRDLRWRDEAGSSRRTCRTHHSPVTRCSHYPLASRFHVRHPQVHRRCLQQDLLRRPRPRRQYPGADGRPGAKLWAAGHDAVGDAGPRPQAQQRQRSRAPGPWHLQCRSVHRQSLRVKCENNVEPMPTITASTMTLTPDEMTLPSTRSAAKAVLPNSQRGSGRSPRASSA